MFKGPFSEPGLSLLSRKNLFNKTYTLANKFYFSWLAHGHDLRCRYCCPLLGNSFLVGGRVWLKSLGRKWFKETLKMIVGLLWSPHRILDPWSICLVSFVVDAKSLPSAQTTLDHLYARGREGILMKSVQHLVQIFFPSCGCCLLQGSS